VAIPLLLAALLSLTVLPTGGPGGALHAPPSPVASPGPPAIAPVAARPSFPASGAPYIESTIDLRNQTLRAGSFVPGDGLFPYSPCYAQSVNLIYVANTGTNYVTILSAVNHSLVGYLPVDTDGAEFCQVAGGNVYFAGAVLHLVQVFNTTTQELVANITIPGAGVLSFAYNSVQNWVYISVVTRPWTVTAISNVNFSLLVSQSIRNAPATTVFDPVNNELYIGDDSDNANVLNATTLAYITNITIGLSPQSGVWDPLNNMVFLGAEAPYNADDLAEVNPVNNSVVALLTMNGWPNYTAMSPSGQWLYFAMSPGFNVTVMNATNISQQYTIQIGTAPDGIAFDSATDEIVTANQATNNVTFINATTDRVDDTVAVGVSPAGLAYDPTTADLFIADPTGDEALVWSVLQNRMVGSVPLPGAPTEMVYDATSGSIFALRPAAGLLSEIDPTSLEVQESWVVPFGSPSFAVDSAAGQYFASNSVNFTIDVGRLSDGAPIATIATIQPSDLQYCPATGLVYAVVGGDGDELIAIEPANDSVVATGGIGLIGAGIACNPFNGDVYVTNQRAFNVSVLNGTTLAYAGSYTNGGGGSGVDFDSQNAELLAASDNPPLVQTALIPGNLTLLDTRNGSVVATLPSAVDPGAVAYDPANDTFFVANGGSGTVSIVQPNTAPPKVASVSLSPSLYYYSVGSAFNATALATSIFGVPCPPGVSYSWRVSPADLATPSGTNSSTEGFVASGTTGTGSITVNASFDGGSAAATAPLQVVGASTVPLASASISPTSQTLLAGGSQVFSATALLQGGGPAPTSTVYDWSLSPITLGTLNSTSGTVVNFTASAVGSGKLTVSVYYGGSYEFATSSITILAAVPEVVARLVLSPSAPSVAEAGSLLFSAIAYDAAGSNISGLATYDWQLEAPALGTLVNAPGYRESYSAGNSSGNVSLSVRASLNGSSVWANTTIDVLPPATNGSNGHGSSGSLFSRVPLWAWAGLVVLVVVAAAVLVLARRRPPPPTLVPVTPFEPGYIDSLGVEVPAEEADEPTPT
jgi:DNA-binding beta-propeller fold protein YncE